MRRLKRLLGAALTLVAFTVPVYLFVHVAAAPALGRLPVPAVTMTAAELARLEAFPSYRAGVPVLTYHDIGGGGGRHTVTLRRFAEQMAALRAAGFHAIGAAQFTAFVRHGAPLPRRPILITFDDGLHSAWSAADPVLARYGMRAVMFVIAGEIGRHRPYYLDGPETRDLVASGRWDVGGHTSLGHRDVAVDGDGDVGPFLTNRRWLPAAGRLETRAEFTGRVAADLDASLATFRALGLPRPLMFAYPFSAAEAPTDDPALVPILRGLVAARFAVSVVDDDASRFVGRADARGAELPRFLVTRGTTADTLTARLRAAAPVAPRLRGLGHGRWVDERGRRAAAAATLRAPAKAWRAAYWSPAQSAGWRDYGVSLLVAGLGSPSSGANGTLLLRAGAGGRIAVTLAAGRVTAQSLTVARAVPLGTRKVPPRPRHRLRVRLSGRALAIVVDGRTTLRLSLPAAAYGGVGLGVWRARVASPLPSFSQLEVVPG